MASMNRSKGEAAFGALGMNPQFLINDILNMIDDGVDAAFDLYHQQAAKIIGSGGDGRSMASEDLARGISSLRCLVETELDKQLSIWERYCLLHCFSVPEEFVLPKNHSSSENCVMHPKLPDEQLNLQLDTLRMKLAEAEKKHSELQSEIYSLEKQTRYDAAIVETVQLFEQNSVSQIFKDIEEAASKLQKKMQEAMASMKDDAERGGLINISMLKEGIRKEDEALFTRLEEIQDVVKLLNTK